MRFVHLVLEHLVKICAGRGIHIVLSIQENEAGKLSEEANRLISSGAVELITVKYDYGPSTKMIPCFMRYPEAVTIVVDDDILLSESALDKFIKYRSVYPNAVLGFRIRKIELDGDKLRPFVGFDYDGQYGYATELKEGYSISEPLIVPDGLFEHVGAVSYPANYPRLTDDEWRSITSKTPMDDDVAMQVVNMRYGFETILLPGISIGEYVSSGNPIIDTESLWGRSGNGKVRANAMSEFEGEFVSYVKKGKNK